MNEKKITAKIKEDENIEGILNLEPLRGPNGYSAYELYVKNLVEGETPLTELEWLDSINKINYYRQYKQTVVTEQDNTSFIPIEIKAYNKTCLLEVFLNGLRLDDTEYFIDNDNKQVVLTNAINKDQTIHLIVSKTIVSTASDFDLLKGEQGNNGTDGKDGLGVPNGGTTGQVLAKKSDADNDTEWIDLPEGTGGAVTGDTLPIGSVTVFAGSIVPSNWLLCNGSEVSRTDYSELFNVIGTTYGTGDGSTTFKLPDLRDKFVIGTGDDNTLGSTGGEKEHILTEAELPEHRHNYTNNRGTGSQSWGGLIGTNKVDGVTLGTSGSSYAGNNQPHNNMPPYIAQTFIIKAKQSAGVVATVVDRLDNDSSIDALSARQGKILNEKIEDVYSTEEVKTNKVWIDGKPIYRKVFVKPNINISSGTYNLNININFETLISLQGMFKNNNGNYPLNNSESQLYYDTSVKVRTIGNWGSGDITIILEYTKTTD